MKIALIQHFWQENYGIMYISSFLKKYNHECHVFIKGAERNLVHSIYCLKPDIVGFSITTGSQQWALDMAGRIKDKIETLTIFGGPHATFYPDIIYNNQVDIVCIGEGIEALAELAEKVRNKTEIYNIRNLWLKVKGQIYKNKVRPLISDLDLLPLPDRSIYYKYKFLRDRETKVFLTAIGCPFLCSFCSNHAYGEIYSSETYYRQRTINSIIKEIEDEKKIFNFKTVIFADDVFTFNKNWLKEFLKVYKNKVDLPFLCSVRVDNIDEETAKILKESGCYGVSFGIETGDEFIRREILNKNITDEQYIRTSRMLKKNGLLLRTTNMFCLPGESIENAFKTIRLNIKCKVDHPFSTIYQPLPSTQLSERCKKDGLLNKDFKFEEIESLYFNKSVLNLQQDKKEIINIHNLFYLLVKSPALIKIAKYLIKLPNNLIFNAIFIFCLLLNYKNYRRLSFFRVINFFIYNLKGSSF